MKTFRTPSRFVPTVLGASLPVIFALAAFNCTTLTPAQTNGITLGIDATVCVLNHITEPPAQIAIDCGLAEIGDVTKVLAAHYAAELRENNPPLTDAGAQ